MKHNLRVCWCLVRSQLYNVNEICILPELKKIFWEPSQSHTLDPVCAGAGLMRKSKNLSLKKHSRIWSMARLKSRVGSATRKGGLGVKGMFDQIRLLYLPFKCVCESPAASSCALTYFIYFWRRRGGVCLIGKYFNQPKLFRFRAFLWHSFSRDFFTKRIKNAAFELTFFSLEIESKEFWLAWSSCSINFKRLFYDLNAFWENFSVDSVFLIKHSQQKISFKRNSMGERRWKKTAR